MSGVFGYIGRPGSGSALDIVTRMGERMCHAPHQAADSTLVGPSIGLGRISIGIFNRAPQPRRSSDGQVSLWLTGEFYHLPGRTAGQDDAEIALQAYLDGGVEGLTKLNGAFTIAVWDGRSETLLLVNDRFGLYPHYYSHVRGAFAFAPEIKGVLCAPEVPRSLDRVAIAQFVRFQQLLGERTWLEDVHMLPPATVLRYRPGEGRLTLARYWDWGAIGLNDRISFDDAVDESIRLLQRAIDAMTAPPHRAGVYLSGGLDGRTILGFIRPEIPVTCVTFGAPGCRDVIHSETIARRAGRPRRWFPLYDGRWVKEYAPLHLRLTEGMHSWVHAHGITTHAAARELMDVNLSGWDGATILGGYFDEYYRDHLYRRAPNESALAQRFFQAFCYYLTWPGMTEAEASALFLGRGADDLRGVAFDSLRAELARTAHYRDGRRADYFTIEQSLRRSLQNQIVTARASIEVRAPFFDYDLISFIFSLPEKVRATPQFHRSIITRRMPELARIPYDKDNRLPHSSPYVRAAHALVQRGKSFVNRRVSRVFPEHQTLYADYEAYLRTDLRDWGASILFDRRTTERGLFDPSAVRNLWDLHQSGSEIWTIGKVAPLITLELVLRTFIDGEGAAPAAPADPAEGRDMVWAER